MSYLRVLQKDLIQERSYSRVLSTGLQKDYMLYLNLVIVVERKAFLISILVRL